jgi:hypothetical protein
MEIRFAQSARKHRIGKARVVYVVGNYSYEVLESEETNKIQYLWIATDDRGLELEIIGVVVDQYVLITHVMPTSLRRKEKQWRLKVKRKIVVGPDVDLDTEVVLLPDGTRLTE